MSEVDFIGFHGQTILHNAEEKVFSIQLGDGDLLSHSLKKKILFIILDKTIF